MWCFRRQHNRSCRLLSAIVLASLLAFMVAVYFYAHLHVLPDGRIIVHSHALPKTDRAGTSHQHTHNNLELFVLDQFSGFKALIIAATLFLIAAFVKLSLFSTYNPLVDQFNSLFFSRRGPPLLY